MLIQATASYELPGMAGDEINPYFPDDTYAAYSEAKAFPMNIAKYESQTPSTAREQCRWELMTID